MKKNPLAILLISTLCLALTSGCAITERKNRLLLNSLDRTIQDSSITKTTTGKVLAAPLVIPIGTAAVAIDAAVLTPVRAAGPAWEDTYSSLWENPQGSDLRRMMLLIPKVAATPVVFTTDWACRSLFSTSF